MGFLPGGGEASSSPRQSKPAHIRATAQSKVHSVDGLPRDRQSGMKRNPVTGAIEPANAGRQEQQLQRNRITGKLEPVNKQKVDAGLVRNRATGQVAPATLPKQRGADPFTGSPRKRGMWS